MNESGMQHAICIILYRGTYTGLGSHSSSTDAAYGGRRGQSKRSPGERLGLNLISINGLAYPSSYTLSQANGTMIESGMQHAICIFL